MHQTLSSNRSGTIFDVCRKDSCRSYHLLGRHEKLSGISVNTKPNISSWKLITGRGCSTLNRYEFVTSLSLSSHSPGASAISPPVNKLFAIVFFSLIETKKIDKLEAKPGFLLANLSPLPRYTITSTRHCDKTQTFKYMYSYSKLSRSVSFLIHV